MLPDTDPGLALALSRERLQLHALNVVPSMAATMLTASLVVALCWKWLPAGPLLAWWLAVGLALAVRLGVVQRQRRSQAAGPTAVWLRRHRIAYALHGAVWGALGLWVLPGSGHGAVEVLTFGVAAMVGGSLVTGAFDARAALAFALPAALPTLASLGADGETHLLLVSALFMAVMGLASRRSSAHFRDQLRAMLAEERRAQDARSSALDAEAARRELADQHALLRQLIDGTAQGFWFVAPDGATLDVNPAMCELLGRPREQVLRLGVFDCFSGPEREVLDRQLELRRGGRVGGYEVDIVRPDGSRVHAFNNATPIYRADGTQVGSIGLWTDLTPIKRLQRELHTYERVTQSIHDMVTVVDGSCRLLLVNDAWCRGSGVARPHALGRPLAEHALQLGAADAPGLVDRCLASGQVETVTADARLADGTTVRLQTSCIPYRDAGEGDRVRAVVLVSRDVTAEQLALERLRHREAELRALFDAFPGYISVVDEDLRYVVTNPRATAMLGYAGENLAGKPIESVLAPELARRFRAEMARVAAGEVVLVERQLAATPARASMVIDITHVAGPPGPDGRRLFYSFGLDVTARKRAQDEAARARDEAERANRAKSRFLSHMSHELRTPLNAISGFAQLLERDRRAPLVPHQRDWVAQILRGGQHLSQLIGEVLDLARIEAGQLALETEAVALPGLADECVAFVRELAGSRGVSVRPAVWPAGPVAAVVADRTRLKQVLLNLLSNAIKYNRAAGEVRLGADVLGGRVRLWVRDTGPGLSDEQQARLFQPFERLGAERGTVEGTGIGLLVSRHLIEAMGGTMGASSRLGQGSEFWLELAGAEAPVREVAAPVALPGPTAPPPSRKRNRPVLCVDDNPVNLMLLQAMLDEACGLTAVTLDKPADALAQARALRPRLVLLDIHMPGLDGYRVLAQLRADPRTADLPVVAVSADAHAHEIETARAAGFDDYLTKPIELDALRAVLERVNRVTGVDTL